MSLRKIPHEDKCNKSNAPFPLIDWKLQQIRLPCDHSSDPDDRCTGIRRRTAHSTETGKDDRRLKQYKRLQRGQITCWGKNMIEK